MFMELQQRENRTSYLSEVDSTVQDTYWRTCKTQAEKPQSARKAESPRPSSARLLATPPWKALMLPWLFPAMAWSWGQSRRSTFALGEPGVVPGVVVTIPTGMGAGTHVTRQLRVLALSRNWNLFLLKEQALVLLRGWFVSTEGRQGEQTFWTERILGGTANGCG